MGYRLGKNLALDTYTFRDVQLKRGLIGLMKVSWMQRQLAVILLDT